MERSRTPDSKKPVTPHVSDSASVGPPVAETPSDMTSESGAVNHLPVDGQMQSDIVGCLMEAMAERLLDRDKIGTATVPSKQPIDADETAWDGCLWLFGENLRKHSCYSFYKHRSEYASATIDMPFSEIVLYLKKRALAQFKREE